MIGKSDYLLDTNAASAIMTGHPPRVRQRVARLADAQVAISVVTEAELRFGAVRRSEATRLRGVIEEFLRRTLTLPWDSEAASHYAHIRAAIERTGHSMAHPDLMIAAHARSVGATLVTNDRAFRHIQHLKIEDWSRR